MPEVELRVMNGLTPVWVGHLNPDDELEVDQDDDGNWTVNVVGAAPAGVVHEVSVGPGAAGGVVQVFPPNTEAQAVAESEKEPSKDASAPAPKKEREEAEAQRDANAQAAGVEVEAPAEPEKEAASK
jgi:hypothetical protein